MRKHQRGRTPSSSRWHRATFLAGCLVVTVLAAAQDHPVGVSAPVPQLPATLGARLKAKITPAYEGKTGSPPADASSSAPLSEAYSEPAATPGGARVITLREAQQRAGVADPSPLARLGRLQVEVARQNRLATASSFFPQIGSDFANLHFNKFMGQLLQVRHPLLGTSSIIGLPLLGQNQTLVAVTATQPITPLFQLQQAYRIAVADERIAKAKAGMPVTETARKVEKNYYELLIAQRQLTFAQLRAKEFENKWLLASSSATPLASAGDDEELLQTSNALAVATTKVKELTASLNDLLGWPSDTELQLVPPDPSFEDISLKEATAKAMAANPAVIEAEQNLVKARSAATLQKLSYVPTLAAMGGYVYNGNVFPLLPRDFSFVGLIATYNLFDFGKREHVIKGANAQAEMAELALQLTKAKVAAAVRNSVLELERWRQVSELSHHMASAIQLRRASYDESSAEVMLAKKVKVEGEMFQADLSYREALAKLKTLMGE
jgi:outer membrane protein TolC